MFLFNTICTMSKNTQAEIIIKHLKYLSVFLLILIFKTSVSYADTKVLNVGVFNHFPVIFYDSNSHARGIFVDLLNKIAEEEEWTINYVNGTWSEGMSRVYSGELDLICSVMHSPEREKTMDFSRENIITIWGQLYIQKNSTIENILDLEGMRIGIMEKDRNGMNFQELCQKFDVKPEIIQYQDFESIFRAIESGRIDGGVVTSTFGLTHHMQHGIRQSPIMFSPNELFFASQKGLQRDALNTIDQYIRTWKETPDSYYYAIINHLMRDKQFTVEKVPEWMYYLLFSTLSVLLIGIMISLVARIHSQKEKLNLQNQLFHSQKMETVGNLAGGIAHDFNNLLTIIRGNAELIQFNEDLSDHDKESLHQILNACDNATFLTMQLLTFSRKEIV